MHTGYTSEYAAQLAEQADHDAKVDAAEVVVSRAIVALGRDSVIPRLVDLLADNFDWSLAQCQKIAREFE